MRRRAQLTIPAVVMLCVAVVAVVGLSGPATARSTAHAPRPSSDAADRCLIDATYQAFLARSASDDELGLWSAHLGSGGSPAAMVNSLALSDEWLEVAITGVYLQALSRPPDPAGLRFWSEQVRRGVPVTRIATQVYGSDEFYRRAGGTDAAFVADLYDRILNRPGDPAGIEYWAGVLDRRPRSWVAAAFYGSFESRGDRVDGLFEHFLGRLPDPQGRAYWIGRLASIDDVRLAISLGSSREFGRRAPTFCATGVITRITSGNDDTDGAPAVSTDGRFVVFASASSNLVAGDTNGRSDIFLRDRIAGTTTRVTDGNDGSFGATISADGTTVAFWSDASDLVAADDNGTSDVFVWDRASGTTARVSGGPAISGDPSVSADGTTVVYESLPVDPETGDPTGPSDVYTWDRFSSHSTQITDGNQYSGGAGVSSDGGLVTFVSYATNLVTPDTNARADIFVWSAATDEITRVTHGNADSYLPAISGDGGTVAFTSDASDLVGGDTNGNRDVFLWERAAGTTTRIPGDGREGGIVGAPSLSGDGDVAAFASLASDLVPGDTNGLPDVFLWHRATGAISRLTDGNGVSGDPALSGDGGTVAFLSLATNLAPPDPNDRFDVFAWDRQS